MPETIQVGVITNAEGAHLSDYFMSLAKTDEAAGVHLVDPSGKTAELARKALGAKLQGVYKEAGDMLRKVRPAMALVSLEAALAPPAIDAALDANCHVFSEKPACVRAEDFEKLVRKAQQNHRHLMLALANRVHAPVVEAKRLVQKDTFGRIYATELHLVADQTRLTREAYRQSWFCDKKRAGGGHLIWLGIHWLDMIMHITGLRAMQVAGFTGVVGGQPINVEDASVMSIQWNNRCFGTMTSGYFLDRGYHSHLQVWGEHGWLKFSAIEDAPLEWYSTRDKKPAVQTFKYPAGQRGYFPFVRAAVRASAGLQAAPISPEDGLQVLKTIFAFYQAAETGRSVKV